MSDRIGASGYGTLPSDGWARHLSPTPIAVLLGGPSAEHDVSIMSGLAIAWALAERGHPVEPWLIDLAGRWWSLPGSVTSAAPEPLAFDDPPALAAAGPFSAPAVLERLADAATPPVVFPALHGPFGEDGTIQALAGSVGLVCCGSGVAASAVGMDKTLFKRICGALELPVLPWVEVRARDWQDRPREVLGEVEAFLADLPDQRLVVKPARLGSSIGISIVHRPDEPPELEAAVEDALRHGDLVLAEPYIDHPRELEAAVMGAGRADLEVFGPGEVLPGREFYDFVAKYRSEESRTLVAPELDPVLAEDIRRIAAEAFLATGASGFARVDFLVDRDGTPWLSEINTIPGFTPISLFPKLCAAAGHEFGAVCERIVALALERDALSPVRRLTRADLP